MLSQDVVPVLLLTVRGHVRPIGGSGCRDWGGPMAPRLARGLHVSLGRGGSKLGGRALLMTPLGLGHGGKMSPEVLISPQTSSQGSAARVGWSLSFVPQETDMLSALLVSRLYWGPLQWGFNDRTGCRISPSVGYHGILIPDSGEHKPNVILDLHRV
jgi:hypothetical protein